MLTSSHLGFAVLSAAITAFAVGCASPSDAAGDAQENPASASSALITPPADSGGFTYVADFSFKNGANCIQPGATDVWGIVPKLDNCANAGAKLSVYKQPDGRYNICVRDSLKQGIYEDAYENEFRAYVGRCLTRIDKNSLRFVDGVTLSIKWEAKYEAQPGRFIDKTKGVIGFIDSDRFLTNVSSNAKLQSATGAGGAAGADQIWSLTQF